MNGKSENQMKIFKSNKINNENVKMKMINDNQSCSVSYSIINHPMSENNQRGGCLVVVAYVAHENGIRR